MSFAPIFVFWILQAVSTLTKLLKDFENTNRINLQKFPVENAVHIEILYREKPYIIKKIEANATS